MPGSPADAAVTFCATLLDEWAHAGVRDVVLAPGSRSTPMALAAGADPRLRVHVVLDERSAAFCALGLGRVTDLPAPVVTTSGTAAVNLHPAAVEAHHAAVPMLLCTADRPPRLQGRGAPQTIDQRGLFGVAARKVLEPGVPRADGTAAWRGVAAEALAASTGPVPGPVQLDLAFDEPLVGAVGDLPPREDAAPTPAPPLTLPPPAVDRILRALELDRPGVVVAGNGCGGTDAVADLAGRLGWPLLADPTSGCRDGRSGVVGAYDLILRSGPHPELGVDQVLRLGGPPASKALGAWIAEAGCEAVVALGPEPSDPRGGAVAETAAPAAAARQLLDAVGDRSGAPGSTGVREAWRAAEAAAQVALDRALGEGDPLTEPAVARTLVEAVPAGGALVVSSSMPVRDVESFGRPRPAGRILANRGVNGIDGVTSTALGVALAGAPTVALLGDLAFLHDTNGLLPLATADVDLAVVVVDNDGGGIFSFLPQAEALPPAVFEAGWGTPHGLDLVAVARAHGVPADRVTSRAELLDRVRGGEGPRVVVVPTDRAANVVEHRRLADGVGAAVAAALGRSA